MIKLDKNYSEHVKTDDPKYPFGKGVRSSGPNQFDGTPWLELLMNDIHGAKTALFKAAFGNNKDVSGNPDTVSASDFVDSLLEFVIKRKISELSACSSAELAAKISDETGTGKLVFSDTPTLNNPIVGTQAVTDNSTKAASTAFVVNEIKRIAYPIGAWVVRYPGMQHPAELYGGTWSKVETDGYFPRFTGGNAAVVNGDVYGALPETVQGDAIRNIVGKFGRGSGPGYFDISSGAFSLAGPSSGIISYGGGYNVPHAVDFNAAYVVPTASENRPYNKTCVLYKKTAL